MCNNATYNVLDSYKKSYRSSVSFYSICAHGSTHAFLTTTLIDEGDRKREGSALEHCRVVMFHTHCAERSSAWEFLISAHLNKQVTRGLGCGKCLWENQTCLQLKKWACCYQNKMRKNYPFRTLFINVQNFNNKMLSTYLIIKGHIGLSLPQGGALKCFFVHGFKLQFYAKIRIWEFVPFQLFQTPQD